MNPDRWVATALLALSAIVALWRFAVWVRDLVTGTDSTDPWEEEQ